MGFDGIMLAKLAYCHKYDWALWIFVVYVQYLELVNWIMGPLELVTG